MELVLLHLPISLYVSHDVQVHYIQHNFSMTMNMRFPIYTLIGLVLTTTWMKEWIMWGETKDSKGK